MSLDLNKPLRLKKSKEPVKFGKKIDNAAFPICVIRTGPDGRNWFWVSNEDELENIPQSRWLNVYVGAAIMNPRWHESKERALTAPHNMERVAVIEDKQDGSDWIVHKLEGK